MLQVLHLRERRTHQKIRQLFPRHRVSVPLPGGEAHHRDGLMTLVTAGLGRGLRWALRRCPHTHLPVAHSPRLSSEVPAVRTVLHHGQVCVAVKNN